MFRSLRMRSRHGGAWAEIGFPSLAQALLAVLIAVGVSAPPLVADCPDPSPAPALTYALTAAGSCSSFVDDECVTGDREAELYAEVGVESYVTLAVTDLDTVATTTAPECSEGGSVYCDPYWQTCKVGGDPTINWSGSAVPAIIDNDADDGDCDGFVANVLTLRFDKPGNYTLVGTVSDSDTNEQRHDTGGDITINYVVKPAVPACPPGGAPARGCGPIGGPGCGGGCSGDDDIPLPLLTEPIVPVGPPESRIGPGGASANLGRGKCRRRAIKLLATCCSTDPSNSILYAVYKHDCPRCCAFAVDRVLEPGQTYATEQCGLARITWVPRDSLLLCPYARSGMARPEPTRGQGDGLDSSGDIEFTVEEPDGTTSVFTAEDPTDDTEDFTFERGPDVVTFPDGSSMQYSYGATEDTVTLPSGEQWHYFHAAGDDLITKVTAPDGTYTELGYTAAGALESVTVKDSDDDPIGPEITYSYDGSGRLESVERDSVTIASYAYTFTEDPPVRRITVTNVAATPDIVTAYDYGDSESDTTTVTVDPAGASPQTTVYTFATYSEAGVTVKGDLESVLAAGDEQPTTQTVDGATGRVTFRQDPTGLQTSYQYNAVTGALTDVTVSKNYQTLSTEHNEYYTYLDGQNQEHPTVWIETHQDTEGNWTYYQRNLQSTPWQVDAIKVAPAGQEPDWDDPEDPDVTTVKTFEYYTADCQTCDQECADYPECLDGRKGMLRKETVPGVGGAVAQVTEYKYGFGVAGKWRDSPTETIYQFWNGSTYEAKTSTAIYDNMGRLLSTTDGSTPGRTVAYRYDALGRQTHTVYEWTDSDSDKIADESETLLVYTQNSYTCCGLQWSRDENGYKTYYGYDGANRLAKTWTDITGQGANTPLVSYTYDAFGNQQTVTTRSGASTSRVTGYDYDSANRVTKIEYPGGIVGDEEFGYDDAGGLLWKKDGNGKFTLYQYDDLHRLIAVYYLPGALPNPISYEGLTADVTYTYHGGTNQRETMTNAAGTSEFEYDAQGRLSQYTPPLGLNTGYYVEYAYNNAGQKTGVKVWNGTTANYDVSYEYYANGWLKSVKYGGNTVASYSYDAVGNRTRVDYGNETYTTFAYESGDPRYRLETITHYDPDDEALATFGYTRDDVGNPLSFTGLEGAWAYTYDAMNRLASATPPSVPLPAQAGGTYSYDWVGNIKAAAASNPWTYNAADQLTLWPGMHSYVYDDNGALTAVKTADGQAEQQTFTYHPSGLMNTASFGGQTLTNLWDADEHRVRFGVGEDEYTAVFDVTAGVPAVIKETTTQGTIYYVREPGGELLCRVIGEDRWYYHFDELGSTRLITSNASPATVTNRYSYDAYGSVISHDRNTGTVDQPYQYVGQLGYYTHWQAPEFGWLQLGVRFYDPETGRFERRDDLADGTTDYQYALLNPESFVDDGGLKARRPLKKPLPRHMPQPRKLRKPSPHPVIPGKHPSMVKEFWRKLKPWARRINMCKAAVDWPCRTAVAFHVYLACGQQRDMQCFESALDDLEHGLSVVGSAGGIDRGLAWVGRQCLEQVRSEADLAGDVWGWVRKHLP